MIWILGAIAAVAVVVIALVAVGTTIGTLEQRDAPAVLLVEEAVEWIAERLPVETAGRLSYDDVTAIVEWHLEWFATVGLGSEFGETLATPEGAESDEVVAVSDESIDYVVAQALAAEHAYEPVDVVVVVDLQHQYLRRIGAMEDHSPEM